MKAVPLAISDVLRLSPAVFDDTRGFFFESFHQERFEGLVGRPVRFVQDNHSFSVKHVLRGLHYQIGQSQGKLVRVVDGEVFDVAVDLRKRSSSFGSWVAEILSAKNNYQLWIPEGFAHGFLVLSQTATLEYKTTAYYSPQDEYCLAWNDPRLQIAWPITTSPIVSPKDAAGKRLSDAAVFG